MKLDEKSCKVLIFLFRLGEDGGTTNVLEI